MQKFRTSTILFFVSILFLSVSCVDNTATKKNIADNVSFEVKTKTEKLAEQLFKNGNFITGETSPRLISSEEVYNLLDENIHILDIRGAYDYSNGHIKNAVNVSKTDVIDYAQVKGLPIYDKVILVCYSGQSATFSAALLQMIGYNNVYVLEWGMSGWNNKFSKFWKTNTSDEGIEDLTDEVYSKNNPTALPTIESDRYSGQDILYKRAKAMEKEMYSFAAVDYEYYLENADDSYVICYQPEEIYNSGHLKNAVLYNQENSLNLATDLLTLPIDKEIIIYSNKGYQSTFLATYLRMLGYNAKTLKYGANSLMYSRMNAFGTSFENNLIKNYPYQTSVYVEEVGGVQEGGC
jgi:rhodanese-related sulfurtransferase